MPKGYMKFNKAIKERWSPERNAQFEDFMSKGEVLSETIERADSVTETTVVYCLNHPHFLITDGEPSYTLTWKKVLRDNNYLDTIISLNIVRDDFKFETVQYYNSDSRKLLTV